MSAGVVFVDSFYTKNRLENRTKELLTSLARGSARYALQEINHQGDILVRMSNDRKVEALIQVEKADGVEDDAITLKKATHDHATTILNASVEASHWTTFYSVLLVDEQACPLAIWSKSEKCPLHPPFPGEPRDAVRSQCHRDANTCHDPRETCEIRENWWYHSFYFREYVKVWKTSEQPEAAKDGGATRCKVSVFASEDGGASQYARSRVFDAEQGASQYAVSRVFASEDDGALKYAVSVPMCDRRHILVGTAPPSWENLLGNDPGIIVGLLGFRGDERCDKDLQQDPDRANQLLVLVRIGPESRGTVGTDAFQVKNQGSASPAGRECRLDGGVGTSRVDYCNNSPKRDQKDPLARALAEWPEKAALYKSVGKPNAACPNKPPEVPGYPFEWEEGGRRYVAQLYPVGCAGLVAFAAHQESTLWPTW